MDKPVTYIIVRSYFMADFILEPLRSRDDIEIVHHTPRRGAFNAVRRSLRMALGNPRGLFNKAIFTDSFLEALPHIRPFDRVLLWGVENYKYVMMMARELPTRHIVSFLWNPMHRLSSDPVKARRYAGGMRRMGVAVCTFDRDDSERLGCRLVRQVHRRVSLPASESTEPSVFFVGYEKGREEQLAAILAELDAAGLRADIRIVRSKHHRPAAPQVERCLIDRAVGYDEVLRAIAASTCLIDLLQPGQSGVTLRTLEAMFYGKRLITNNRAIRRQPFYSPDRIFIVGDEPDRSLADFLSSPAPGPLPEAIFEAYTVGPWLDALLAEIMP